MKTSSFLRALFFCSIVIVTQTATLETPIGSLSKKHDSQYTNTNTFGELWKSSIFKKRGKSSCPHIKTTQQIFNPHALHILTKTRLNHQHPSSVLLDHIAELSEGSEKTLEHRYANNIRALSWINNAQLASAANYTVQVMDVETQQSINTRLVRNKIVTIECNPHNTTLATLESDGTIRLGDTRAPINNTTLLAGEFHPSSLNWKPTTGDTLALGSWNGDIILWDIRQRRPITRIPTDKNSVASLQWSPDAENIASCAWDGTITIKNTRTGKSLTSLHDRGTSSFTWHPNNDNLFTTGSRNGTVKLWPMEKPKSTFLEKLVKFIRHPKQSHQNTHIQNCTTALNAHNNRIVSMTWDPEGTTLSSISGDGIINMWEAEKKRYEEPQGTHQVVLSAAWSRNRRILAAAGITWVSSHNNTARNIIKVQPVYKQVIKEAALEALVHERYIRTKKQNQNKAQAITKPILVEPIPSKTNLLKPYEKASEGEKTH